MSADNDAKVTTKLNSIFDKLGYKNPLDHFIIRPNLNSGYKIRSITPDMDKGVDAMEAVLKDAGAEILESHARTEAKKYERGQNFQAKKYDRRIIFTAPEADYLGLLGKIETALGGALQDVKHDSAVDLATVIGTTGRIVNNGSDPGDEHDPHYVQAR